MTISERLLELINYSSLSNRAFAMKCGLKQATFDKQVRGITSISIDTIESILINFPEISAEWLLRGEGSMIKGEAPSKDLDRLNKLVDTIATLQDVINDKSASLTAALERIRQLESQLK